MIALSVTRGLAGCLAQAAGLDLALLMLPSVSPAEWVGAEYPSVDYATSELQTFFVFLASWHANDPALLRGAGMKDHNFPFYQEGMSGRAPHHWSPKIFSKTGGL